MSTNNQSESTDREMINIKENYEDEYWSKTYGVTAEELKKEGSKVGIFEKIINASFKKKAAAL